jgi:hypothetical protein
VEAKARKKQVKGSTAGYIRTLYESDAVVGKTPFEEKKEQGTQDKIEEERRKTLEKRRAQLEAENARERTNEAVNSLSIDEKRNWVRRYVDEELVEKAKSCNAETVEFRDKLERMQFLAWLRKRLAPKTKPSEFKVWLKAKGHDVMNVEAVKDSQDK